MQMAACVASADLSGSWIITGTPSDPSAEPFLSLATFTADGSFVGASQGSGACCPILTPGHGVWWDAGANAFVVTFVAVGYDASGDLMGTLNGRLEIQLAESGEQIHGEFSGRMVDSTGATLFTTQGTLQGERIQAQAAE
jgi:hypothetical protein